ncbi:TonB-dependent hemoglobin/transferrin/lactoferrin family receptor [uncultured Pseudoteredinibacter sp.]|uniref:TonB-dependent hemoglobin/transferrin/lactoferrin family receptor n=1 Tax=uncultured Pseudoteredinibacter sp. TaxID=1641701 RepID=UPI00261ABE13|nr:TonB-dependent hemoglobin/transferrin/lactoferrin family receptor [uncultured Pseudoteredinibacter sp.]
MKNIFIVSALSTAISAISYAEEATTTTAAHNDLEEIVVSGTRIEQKLKDVAGSISVVTSHDIDKQLVSNMRDLFRYDPSVNVTGNRGGAQNIVVRGMGSDRILMIKDGMRMNEGYGADGANDIVGRGFIDTGTLKRVEVAKGAASSLYGADALGGIVVFTTKDASDVLDEGEEFAGNVKAGYKQDGKESNLAVTLAAMTGEIEHFLNVAKRDGESNQNFDETLPKQDVESASLLYKLKVPLNDSDYISFSADLWEQENSSSRATGLLQPFRGLAQFGYQVTDENGTEEQETQAFRLAYHAEDGAFYDSLDTFIYQNDSEQTEKQFGALDINAPMFGVLELRDMYRTGVYEQKTKGFITQISKKANWGGLDHLFGYGLDIEETDSRRTVNDYRIATSKTTQQETITDTTSDKFPENTTKRQGLYLNDQIKFLDGALTVTPGLRYDRYDLDANGSLKTDGTPYKSIDDSAVSFNIGALYKLTDDLSLFAQYGQGFKVPPYDLAYIEQDNTFAGYRVIPSEDLDPEESDSYEIGLRGKLDRLAFSAAVFYNKYDNFITTELLETQIIFGRPVNIFQYQNIDSVTIKGAELGLTYYFENGLSTFFNAAYQDGKDDTTGDYIRSISPLSGNAGLSYEAMVWNVELIANWTKSMSKVNEGENKSDGYVTVDLLSEYKVNDQLSINLVLNNLLDKEYIHFGSRLSVDHGSNDSLFTEPGRTVAASVNYRF